MYVYRCPECHGRGIALAETTEHPPRCLDHPQPLPMMPMQDTDKALLPLDKEPAHLVTPGMVPLKVKHLEAAGILQPATQDALEWLYRHRERNGMAGAFLKVGGRRCIDLVAFAKLMREKRA